MEYYLVPKPRVAGSSPVFRSIITISKKNCLFSVFYNFIFRL